MSREMHALDNDPPMCRSNLDQLQNLQTSLPKHSSWPTFAGSFAGRQRKRKQKRRKLVEAKLTFCTSHFGRPFGCGGQNRFGIPFWVVGEFTTHFRTYFSGWIGMFTGVRASDPWPFEL